jgi:trans-resveratrol di-O-methyltransferase
VKILKLCREAICKDEEGKVIIIDMVLENQETDEKTTETQLCFDLLMMVNVNGRERNEKEWKKLFLAAGFSHYNITPIMGLRSLIEVYP